MPMKVRYTVFDGKVVSENRNGTERDYVPDPLGSTVAAGQPRSVAECGAASVMSPPGGREGQHNDA